MLMVPVRGDGLGLASAVNVTFPLPVPLPDEVMLIHEPLEVAVQLHDVPAVTLKPPGPPAAAMLADLEEFRDAWRTGRIDMCPP